jgi:hypothetical protein
MATNGTPAPKKITIDDNPDKFLLFGITYLLATPSDFSKNIVSNGSVDQTKAIQFFTDAGIDPASHQKVIDFANSVAGDSALTATLGQLHDNLQSDFSPSGDSYSPTPCPARPDSVSIMRKMNELRKVVLASALQPPATNKPTNPAQPGNNP